MKFSSERIFHFLPAATLILLAITALTSLATPFVSMFYRIPIKYNEGWNAVHAMAAQSGKNIYIPGEYLFNNYPPLSYYVIGWLGRLHGDYIFAGRYLSMVSLLVAAFCIFAILKIVTRSNFIASFAALYFISLMSLEFHQYVGVNCPQLFAQAVSLVSILLFVWLGESRGSLFAVALLTLAAGLIKHNVFAAPVAISIVLYQNKSGLFRYWILVCAALLTTTLILFYWWFGVHFFEQMVSARMYGVSRIAHSAKKFIPPLLIPFAFVLLSYSIPLKQRFSVFFIWFFVTAAVVAAFFSGGSGIYYNIYFDLIVSLILLTCVRWQGLRNELFSRSPEWSRCSAFVPFVLCLPLFLAAPSNLHLLTQLPRILPEEVEATAKDIEYIARARQPVLCDMLSLCYWAGVPLVYDSFNVREESRANPQFESKILNLLRSKHFGVIHIDRELGISSVRHTDRFLRVLNKNYRRDRTNKAQHYYVPKEP